MAGKSFADHVRPAADDRPDLLAVDRLGHDGRAWPTSAAISSTGKPFEVHVRNGFHPPGPGDLAVPLLLVPLPLERLGTEIRQPERPPGLGCLDGPAA